MLYLKRKIDAFLTEWKANSNRKPLIVKGSKQVVKPNQSGVLEEASSIPVGKKRRLAQ